MLEGHGYDSRWTVRDKLKHYRGLIAICERDKAKARKDIELDRIQTSKKLIDLKKEVRLMRIQRNDNVAAAFLRHIIKDDRRLALSLGEKGPTDLVNEMRQRTCVKQREINKLQYVKNLKMKELENSMIEIEKLKKRKDMYSSIKADTTTEEVLEKEIATTKVKHGAAKCVLSAYQKMIKLMKEDAFYLDQIVSSLLLDSKEQSQCIMSIKEKGEKAAEENERARAELHVLEEKTVAMIRMRDRAIRHLRQQINVLRARLKSTGTEESDARKKVFTLEMLTQVNEDENDDDTPFTLNLLEKGMQYLQEATMVTDYRNIYARLQDQLEQKQRLLMQVAMCEQNRTSYYDKRDCLRESLEKTKHTYTEECKRHEADELIYRGKLQGEKQNKEGLNQLLEELTKKLFDMRAVIITLHEIVGRVLTQDEVENSTEPVSEMTFKEIMSQITNPFETLELIKEKVRKLRNEIGLAVENWPANEMSEAERKLRETKEKLPPEMKEILEKDPTILDDARKEYHTRVTEHITRTHFGGTAPYLYPLEEVKDNEVGVISRAEIKLASRRIMKDCEVMTFGFGVKKGASTLHKRKKIRRRKLTL